MVKKCTNEFFALIYNTLVCTGTMVSTKEPCAFSSVKTEVQEFDRILSSRALVVEIIKRKTVS